MYIVVAEVPQFIGSLFQNRLPERGMEDTLQHSEADTVLLTLHY